MSPSIHKQIITQSFSNIPLCSNIQKSTFPHQPGLCWQMVESRIHYVKQKNGRNMICRAFLQRRYSKNPLPRKSRREFADRSSDVKAPSCEASSNFTQNCEPLDRTDHEHQLIPTIFKRIFPYCSFFSFMVQ